MKKYGKGVSDIKAEMEELDNQDEKNKKKEELEELNSKYERYIRNNVGSIVFPKYLYLV